MLIGNDERPSNGTLLRSPRVDLTRILKKTQMGDDDPPNDRPPALDHPSIRLGLVSKLRRDLIAHLAAVNGGSSELDDLATTLLDEQRDDDDDMLSAYRIQLHHVHLPALEEAGLITYDSEHKRVTDTDGEALTAVAAYLQSHAGEGDEDVDDRSGDPSD
jgi:hypothetical protein